jgi:hypothetical protein
MIPTEKAADIDNLLMNMGFDRMGSISENKCVFCAKPINPETEFPDEISKREFSISGICYTCQNKVFGV